MHGSVSVVIRATPQHVYDLVADVTRMGEWSPECYRCEWIGRTARAEPGARFKGYNRSGLIRWSNVSEIVTADRGRELAWIMGGTEKAVLVVALHLRGSAGRLTRHRELRVGVACMMAW